MVRRFSTETEMTLKEPARRSVILIDPLYSIVYKPLAVCRNQICLCAMIRNEFSIINDVHVSLE